MNPVLVALTGLLAVMLATPWWKRWRRRRWQRTTVTVTQAHFDRTAGDGVSHSLYVVRAEGVTSDGERFAGQARDFYDESSPQWVGTTRPAWYDPTYPDTFTLHDPRPGRRPTFDVSLYAIGVLVFVAMVVAQVR